MRALGYIVALVVFIAITAWSLAPAINCDGHVVRGIYRMVCIEEMP